MLIGILKERLILSAIVFLATAGLFAVQIDYSNPTAELVPLWCVGVALVAAGIQIAKRFGGKREVIVWSGAGLHGYLLYMAFIFLIRYIGFPLATPLFITAVFLVVRKPRTARTFAAGLFFGVTLAAFIYILFVVVMGNLIPMGMLE